MPASSKYIEISFRSFSKSFLEFPSARAINAAWVFEALKSHHPNSEVTLIPSIVKRLDAAIELLQKSSS